MVERVGPVPDPQAVPGQKVAGFDDVADEGDPRHGRGRARVRSNRRINLFGKRITVAEDQTNQYVSAIIKGGPRRVVVVTLNGEIIHDGDDPLSRVLR